MEDNNENTNSNNGDNENSNSENETTVESLKEDNVALEEKNKQLFERAKKAEGFEKDSDGNWSKVEKAEKPKASEDKTEVKSDEPDYAKLAFLEQKGVEHPDDQKIVKDEAERLKLPLTDILQMEHIKAKLQESKDGREAKEGMPKGKGRTGQASKEDVDYYLDKPDELPEDQELAGKVVEARLKKIDKASQFSDIPFIG